MSDTILNKLKQNLPYKRKDLLNRYLREFLVDFLELDAIDDIAPDQSFIELGTDSARAIDFKLKLEETLHCSLTNTVLFDYPRLNLLTDHLIEDVLQLGDPSGKETGPVVAEQEMIQDQKDKIAIIGMACRMPGGAMDPEEFWRLQIDGVDAIEKVPRSRWDVDKFYSPDRKPGAVSNRYGGFMREVELFDARFFNISPKEAVELDPQQRILMEVVWEAVENAGQANEDLKGKNIGVFMGVRNTEYYPPQGYRDPKNINLYSAIGTQLSAASGRVSHFLGVTGPSVSMDTACSSSMTALHFACESIRSGTAADGAIVGGVNIMISAELSVAGSQGDMLSADGRCKTFSAKADGYVRSEACAAIFLKPLAKAINDNDPVLAVIRATGVNQDGASGGLTVPNGPSQESLIVHTLKNANLQPADISYVEAHGTGTPLGDPIEVGALNNTLGRAHTKEHPLRIGSVKTTIGHTEPVAGLAGVIKVAQSMQHEMIPANLHFDPPNPYIPWEDIPISVVKENTPWPKNGKSKRYAGINSFGFTGSNAHVILEEAPTIERREVIDTKSYHLFACSAKTEKALKRLAERYVAYLNVPEDISFSDICYTTTTGRSHFSHRLSVLSKDRSAVVKALQGFLAGETPSDLMVSKTDMLSPKVALFLSPGRMPDASIGRELYKGEPLFKEIINRCDRLLKTTSQESLQAFFSRKEGDSFMETMLDGHMIDVAYRYALTKCLLSWGVSPDLILSHGIGEIISAAVAEVFSLEDAFRLVDGYESFKNGACTKEEFEALARSIDYSIPKIDLVSGVSRNLKGEAIASAGHWIRHLGAENDSAQVPKEPLSGEYACVLQIGTGEIEVELGATVQLLSFEQGLEGSYQLQRIRQAFYALGVPLNWKVLARGNGAVKVRLPNYPFQHKRYWIEESEPKASLTFYQQSLKSTHPLLGRKIDIADRTGDRLHYESFLKAEPPHFLTDHRVYDHAILPGAAYVEMALKAAHSLNAANDNNEVAISLSDISLRQAMVLSEDQVTKVQCSLDSEKSNDSYKFRIHSLSEQGNDKEEPAEPIWTLHAEGVITIGHQKHKDALKDNDIDTIKDRCPKTKESKRHYQEMTEAGLYYGPSFQGVHQIWHNQEEALAEIHLPEVLRPHSDVYRFHPALLDACFQTFGSLLSLEEKREALLPVSITSIQIYRDPAPELWSHLKSVPSPDNRHYIGDLLIMDKVGDPIAYVKGLKLLRVPAHQFNGTSREWKKMLYTLSWEIQQERQTEISETERNLKEPASWLILADQGNLGSELSSRLEEQNERVVMIQKDEIDPTSVEAWEELIEEEFDEGFPSFYGVVVLWGLEETSALEALRGSMNLLQALDKNDRQRPSTKLPPRIWWVTRGGQAVVEDLEKLNAIQAPLWGLRSSMSFEMADHKPICIDLDPSALSDRLEAQQLFEEMWNPDLESQIAYRQGGRYVARLSKYSNSDETAPLSAPFQLRIREYGVLENLEIVPDVLQKPGPSEVQIAIAASALNFKDVLHTLGMLKGHSEQLGILKAQDQPLGFECSGKITEVGKNVQGLVVGDQVIAVAPQGCMKSTVTVDASLVVKKPSSLNSEAAAAIPTVFLTAVYGLEELAKIKKGDRVLIHACAGGVGQAALQVAQRVGATIFATASKGKWDFLRSQGVTHIMDSRTLDFAEDIKRSTHGEGVDIVLNSLRGDYIPKSLEVLAPNGRFVEIGKIDIWSAEKIKQERPDVRYFSFDLGDEIRETPILFPRLLSKITERFALGEYKALPMKTFQISEASKAFQYLAAAKNIGKVVLRVPEIKEGSVGLPQGDKNYLITGGLGFLGLKIAKALAEKGAKHLSLMGRGKPTDVAKQEILVLEQMGVAVYVFQVDVTIEQEVNTFFKAMKANIPVPLGGVVHAAGVLHDGFLQKQDWDSFSKVLSPKVAGSWHLHRCTQHLDLDFFVCFSSMTSVLGAPGQSNYAAANAFMDTLIHYRKGLGLPGISINWGPWKGGGMAAAMEKKMQQRIENLGVKEITVEDGLGIFTMLLESASPQIGVAEIEWPKYFAAYRKEQDNQFLEAFFEDSQENGLDGTSVIALENASIEEREKLLFDHVKEQVVKVLGIDPTEEIDPRQGLFEMGVDSLLAVDLQNRLEASTNQSLSSSFIFDHPTLEALTQYLLHDVLKMGQPQTETQPSLEPQEDALEDEVSNLSEEELASALSEAIEKSNATD